MRSGVSFTTEVFEAQYLRFLGSTVHGPDAMTMDAAGQNYLKGLYLWWYQQVQRVSSALVWYVVSLLPLSSSAQFTYSGLLSARGLGAAALS